MMASKEEKKKDPQEEKHDEIVELNKFIEKTKLRRKVLRKMIDDINKPKNKK